MHQEYTLAANASVWGEVTFNSDPGIVLVVPYPEHAEIGHEHVFRYTDPYVKRFADGKWIYGTRITNMKPEPIKEK